MNNSQSVAPAKAGAIVSRLFLCLLVSVFFFACKDGDRDLTGPRNIVQQEEFTKDMPGHWEGLENEHLPHIKFFPDRQKDNIQISVYLNPSEGGAPHYIEKIGLMNEKKEDVAVVPIKTGRSQSVIVVNLTYPLKDAYKVKVFVKCNIHDLWTAPLVETPPPEPDEE